MYLLDDIIYYIIDFNNTYNSCYNLLNKKYNIIFSKKKYKIATSKIINFYRNYTYPYGIDVTDGNWLISKKLIVDYYRKYYDIEHLLNYPEFIAKKLNRVDLQNYINTNMNSRNKRRKLEVIKFLRLETISRLDIYTAGW
jgi:hypothetical protein